MDSQEFLALEKKVNQTFREGNAIEAIKLCEDYANKHPEKAPSLNLDMAFMLLSINNTEKAVEVLKRSLEKGVWYPKGYFRKQADNEQFKEIFQGWEMLQQEAAKTAKSEYRVYTPQNYDKSKAYPLFIAVHGWGEDVDMFENYWKSQTIAKEYILMLPQSSQQMGSYNYCWNDNEKTMNELQQAYEAIQGDYNIDVNNVIVGGFSQGATVAVDLAINQEWISAKGFVALNPDKPEAFTENNIQAARDSKVKGYIITGDQDDSYTQQQEMMEAFNAAAFDCQIDVIAGWGHWFPEDLGTRIDEAIKYINS